TTPEVSMKRKLALLLGGLAAGLAGLALAASARHGSASAPPVKGAEEAPRVAASRVSHVTVYPDSALVTRDVEVPAGQGLLELVVGPLPEATVPSTLYTESGDGVRVLTTRYRARPVREDTREEVRKVEEEIRKLHAQQRKIQSDISTLTANMALLSN